MITAKLPMPAGLIIEKARAKGIDGDLLVDAIMQKKKEVFQNSGIEEDSLNYLFEFGESHPDTFKNAILGGYEFKFLSIRGLMNFLIAKLGLEEGKDFSFQETHLDDVSIPFVRFDEIRSTVPKHWTFIEKEQNEQYRMFRIELARQETLSGESAR